MAAPKKRRSISLKQKLELIKDEEVNKLSHIKIAEKHRMPRSTVIRILNEKEKIHELVAAEGFIPKANKIRKPKYLELDKAVCTWMKRVRIENIPISGPIVQVCIFYGNE